MNSLTLSTTPDSLCNLNEHQVTVCAHDAGAAVLIAGWIEYFGWKPKLLVSGPARKIFDSKFSELSVCNSLEEALRDCVFLITGTGWQTDWEHTARRQAQKKQITCVGVIDHWVNYRARFQNGTETVLPNAIWVSDRYARNLAETCFPDLPIHQLNHPYLESQVFEYREIRRTGIALPARKLLYLLEPIREDWSGPSHELPFTAIDRTLPGEFQALQYWQQSFSRLQQTGVLAEDNLAITLRSHPTERPGKYDSVVSNLSNDGFLVRKDENQSLVSSLANADCVFGCETQALILGMECGLPCYSTVPPWAPACRLPHDEITSISEIG